MSARAAFESLLAKCYDQCDRSLVPQTRAHPFRSFSDLGDVFVKREDECGFAMAGGKKRKYASLLPFLLKNQFDEVVVIGGNASNNVIGLVQLLLENRIPFKLWTRKGYAPDDTGNRLLLHLLQSRAHWREIERQDWDFKIFNTDVYVDRMAETGKRCYVVPEGANCAPAFPGALTLMDDILRNESEHGKFDHIFVDAGTGFTAAAMTLANALLPDPRKIHALLLGGSGVTFLRTIKEHAAWYRTLTGRRFAGEPEDFELYQPKTAKSFGSVNQKVLAEIKRAASEDGIFLDPVYSAKLFLEARRIIENQKLAGRILLIHSGGAQAMFGYANKLRAL